MKSTKAGKFIIDASSFRLPNGRTIYRGKVVPEMMDLSIILSGLGFSDNKIADMISEADKFLSPLSDVTTVINDRIYQLERAAIAADRISRIGDRIPGMVESVTKPFTKLSETFSKLTDKDTGVVAKVTSSVDKVKDTTSGIPDVVSEQLSNVSDSVKSGIDGVSKTASSVNDSLMSLGVPDPENLKPMSEDTLAALVGDGATVGMDEFGNATLMDIWDKRLPKTDILAMGDAFKNGIKDGVLPASEVSDLVPDRERSIVDFLKARAVFLFGEKKVSDFTKKAFTFDGVIDLMKILNSTTENKITEEEQFSAFKVRKFKTSDYMHGVPEGITGTQVGVDRRLDPESDIDGVTLPEGIATLQVYSSITSQMGDPYMKFLLQSAEELQSESYQLFTTFDQPIPFIFNEKPKIFSYSGVLLDANQDIHWWREKFEQKYFSIWRATELTVNRAILYLTYGNVVRSGYMLNLQISQNAMESGSSRFRFDFLVSKSIPLTQDNKPINITDHSANREKMLDNISKWGSPSYELDEDESFYYDSLEMREELETNVKFAPIVSGQSGPPPRAPTIDESDIQVLENLRVIL